MRTCFIIMPFSKAIVDDLELGEKDLSYIYESFIKRAVNEFEEDGQPYFDEVKRFDSSIGSIVKGIVDKLLTADLVIADLTGNNPNVMYELGVRHSVKRGTIMLTQNFNSFPSDLRDYLAVAYKYPMKPSDYDECYEGFKVKLHSAINDIIHTGRQDSPILEIAEFQNRFSEIDAVKHIKEQTVILNSLLWDVREMRAIIENISLNPASKKFHQQAVQVLSMMLSNIQSKFNLFDFKLRDSFLLIDIEMTLNCLNEMQKSFAIGDFLVGNLSIPDSENPFQQLTYGEVLKKEFINPILLRRNQEVSFVSIDKAFNEIGFIQELLSNIEYYIKNEAIRFSILGEIEDLMDIVE